MADSTHRASSPIEVVAVRAERSDSTTKESVMDVMEKRVARSQGKLIATNYR